MNTNRDTDNQATLNDDAQLHRQSMIKELAANAVFNDGGTISARDHQQALIMLLDELIEAPDDDRETLCMDARNAAFKNSGELHEEAISMVSQNRDPAVRSFTATPEWAEAQIEKIDGTEDEDERQALIALLAAVTPSYKENKYKHEIGWRAMQHLYKRMRHCDQSCREFVAPFLDDDDANTTPAAAEREVVAAPAKNGNGKHEASARGKIDHTKRLREHEIDHLVSVVLATGESDKGRAAALILLLDEFAMDHTGGAITMASRAALREDDLADLMVDRYVKALRGDYAGSPPEHCVNFRTVVADLRSAWEAGEV